MKTNKLRNAIAPFLLTASAVVGAQVVNEAGVGGTANVFNGGPTVLYDQTGATPNANGIPDQNFETAYDVYDAVAADDFEVTDALGWNITQVALTGTTGTAGLATSSAVSFHLDAGGAPDPTPIPGCDFPTATILSDSAGSLVIDLGAGCVVPQGTAWIAHQVDQNFAAAGQHFFSGSSDISGSEAHWVNPGDGFGSGCTTFSPAGSVCGVGGGLAHDLLFSVSGAIAAPQGPPPMVPTLTWYGLGLMLLTFGFLGRRFIKND